MRIQKGDKAVDIPSWALVLGLLVVDNAITNLCKVKIVKEQLKSKKENREASV